MFGFTRFPSKLVVTYFKNAVILLVSCLILASCTNGQIPASTPIQGLLTPSSSISSIMVSAQPMNDIYYQGQSTAVSQMAVDGNQLVLTGYPFGISLWAIDANPMVPSLTWSAAQNIDTFSPFGGWLTDRYALGALATQGNLIFTSGSAGVSVFDASTVSMVQEVRRFPPPDPTTGGPVRDIAFVWKGAVSVPPFLYGFSQQDFLYTLQMNGPDIVSVSKSAYSPTGATVCCVTGAAYFNNQVWVAWTQNLTSFSVGSNGQLGSANPISAIQAYDVKTTSRYLYVLHKPNYSQPAGLNYPQGIYIFNNAYQNVGYIQLDIDATRFAVSPDDAYLYVANGSTSVRVYRINNSQL